MGRNRWVFTSTETFKADAEKVWSVLPPPLIDSPVDPTTSRRPPRRNAALRWCAGGPVSLAPELV